MYSLSEEKQTPQTHKSQGQWHIFNDSFVDAVPPGEVEERVVTRACVRSSNSLTFCSVAIHFLGEAAVCFTHVRVRVDV